jgi:uroporphyrinogen-III decarboxylase
MKNGTMNSGERVHNAMMLKKPDRVPLMASPSWGFILVQNPQIDPVHMWYNHMTLYPQAFCNISKKFHFDGVKIPGAGLAPLNKADIDNIDKEGTDGTVINFKNEDSCTFGRDELPRYQFKINPEKDINEFNPESIPEQLEYHPVSTRLRMNLQRSPDDRVSEIIKAREIMGPEFSIHGQFYSPEDYLIDLFGLENAMSALLTHPDKCKEILIRFAMVIGRHVKELIDAGADAICASAPYSGQNFISLEIYEKIIAPAQKIIVDLCRTNNVPCYCHTCGSIDDRLESIIDAGFNGLECLDPPPLGNVSLKDAIRRIGDRAFIKGNIDPVNVLLNGSVEEVRKSVRNCLEIGMTARGFILSTACTISPHTPAENADVLYEMIEKYGYYK